MERSGGGGGEGRGEGLGTLFAFVPPQFRLDQRLSGMVILKL